MPQVKGGPAELNRTLERAYTGCMKYSRDEDKCSAVAWSVADKQGWHKNDDGNWVKRRQMGDPNWDPREEVDDEYPD